MGDRALLRRDEPERDEMFEETTEELRWFDTADINGQKHLDSIGFILFYSIFVWLFCFILKLTGSLTLVQPAAGACPWPPYVPLYSASSIPYGSHTEHPLA